jgi:hypothetical protein
MKPTEETVHYIVLWPQGGLRGFLHPPSVPPSFLAWPSIVKPYSQLLHILSPAVSCFCDGTDTTFCRPISFLQSQLPGAGHKSSTGLKLNYFHRTGEDLQFEKMIPKANNFSLKKKSNINEFFL